MSMQPAYNTRSTRWSLSALPQGFDDPCFGGMIRLCCVVGDTMVRVEGGEGLSATYVTEVIPI